MLTACTFVVLFAPALLWGFAAGQGNVTFPVTTLQGDGEEGCPSVVQEDAVRANITQDIRMLLQDSIVPAITGGYGTCQCGGPGWTRVAYLDMTDPTQQCPGNWVLYSSPKRSCGKGTTTTDCYPATFSVGGLQYSQVCGRIVAYQYGNTDGFQLGGSASIDDHYVEGVSVTHGSPREHIWSFASAHSETDPDCPCIGGGSSSNIPFYVGSDYFCDTGTPTFQGDIFYPDDPLWDGQGCGSTSTCCTFNNPPWFCKQLPQPTTDYLEVRMCSSHDDEDTPIELMEIFVK